MKKTGIKYLSVMLGIVLLMGCANESENSNSERANQASINLNGLFVTPESDTVAETNATENEPLIIDTTTDETDTDEDETIVAEYQPVQADEIPDYTPKATNGQSHYNPLAALEYAKNNWDNEEGLCAEFGSNCIEAGGISDCWSTSSTQLYNALIKSGEGFAVKVPINENGTINLPEYAFPGDLVFYYCEEENCMVHTLIYNGDSKNGKMKALAHNPANGGVKNFKYRPTCTDGCDAELKDVVLFCFYRNPDIMKTPETVPAVSIQETDGAYIFNWEPDFLYKNSTLVLTDKKRKGNLP